MKKNIIISFCFSLFLLLLCTACERVAIGYLQIDEASYTIDSCLVYKQPLPYSKHGKDKTLPWVSMPMSGVSGTKPIQYTFYSVKATEGGSEEAFLRAVHEQLFIVQGGGRLILKQETLSFLPLGKYTISLRIANDGYSKIKADVFTFIVKDQEEELDQEAEEDASIEEGTATETEESTDEEQTSEEDSNENNNQINPDTDEEETIETSIVED